MRRSNAKLSSFGIRLNSSCSKRRMLQLAGGLTALTIMIATALVGCLCFKFLCAIGRIDRKIMIYIDSAKEASKKKYLIASNRCCVIDAVKPYS